MTDCQFLLHILSDGEPHEHGTILRRSFEERGCGLTIHSRAAELRGRGHYIVTERVSPPGERAVFTYQLLGSLHEPEPQVATSDDLDPATTPAGPSGSWSDSERSPEAQVGVLTGLASSSMGDRVADSPDGPAPLSPEQLSMEAA